MNQVMQNTIQASSSNFYGNRINIDMVSSPTNPEMFSDRNRSSSNIENNVMTSYKYNPDSFQTLQENSSYNYLGNIGNNKAEFNSSKNSFKGNPNFVSADYGQQNYKESKENYNFKFDPSLYKEGMTLPHSRTSNLAPSNSQERDTVGENMMPGKQKSSTNFNVNSLTMKGIRNSVSSKSNTPHNHTPIRNPYMTKQSSSVVSTPQGENFSTTSSTPQMSNRIGSSESKFIGNKYSSILTKDRSASPSVASQNYSSVNISNNNTVRKSMKIPNK